MVYTTINKLDKVTNLVTDPPIASSTTLLDSPLCHIVKTSEQIMHLKKKISWGGAGRAPEIFGTQFFGLKKIVEKTCKNCNLAFSGP